MFLIILLIKGGEKGIPFRLVVSTYTPEEAGGSLISKSFCLIKVFKVIDLIYGSETCHMHYFVNIVIV